MVARARSRGYNIDEDEPFALPEQDSSLTPQPDAAFAASAFDVSQSQASGADRHTAGSVANAPGAAPAFENFADAANAGARNAAWDSGWGQAGWDADPSAPEGSGDFDPPDSNWGNSPSSAGGSDPWR